MLKYINLFFIIFTFLVLPVYAKTVYQCPTSIHCDIVPFTSTHDYICEAEIVGLNDPVILNVNLGGQNTDELDLTATSGEPLRYYPDNGLTTCMYDRQIEVKFTAESDCTIPGVGFDESSPVSNSIICLAPNITMCKIVCGARFSNP